MNRFGYTLRPIELEAGFAAILLSLLATVLLGAFLISTGQPGDIALMAFPSLLIGCLANAAGICHRRHPGTLALLGMLTLLAYHAVLSALQMA
ncbi:hypothetical protein [Lysobacter humi (ex Lee et al. 2017)]